MIRRDMYLKKLEMYTGRDVVKIITGVRRCGKTTLLKQVAKAIIREEEMRKEREANERLWAEIQRKKAEGMFVPTWGPKYNFKDDKK